jgi:hypothetical protein
VVLAVGGFVGYRLLTKKPSEGIFDPIIPGNETPPTCPLTGVEPEGEVPDRPALAVKIENSPDARPQVGLNEANIVYEEEAEGGITRFMAIFHCGGAERIGPVRSARLVDPHLLVQYVRPLFGYAGGAPVIRKEIAQTHEIVDVNYTEEAAADAYVRDPNRTAPHDLFSSTRALYRAGGNRGKAPEPVFEYDEETPKRAKRAPEIHLDFSPTADVFWRWARRDGVWLRSHGETAHTLEDGSQVSATNVVVQLVQREPTDIIDPAGNPVFDFNVVGSGKAVVFRDGKAIKGRWERESEDDVTQFVTRKGDVIPLAPGRTWIELYPTDAPKLDF